MKISPPAFPTYLADNMAHGMMLRDYFAAAALQSFLSRESLDELSKESLTNFAYSVADQMMIARQK
jgi:hypothetical protein